MFPPMPWWGPRKEPESAQAGAASSSASASTTPPKPVASRVNPFLWSSPPEQVRLIRKRCNKSPEPVMKRKLILEYLHLPPMEEIRDGIEELEKTLNLRVVLKATAGAAAEAAAEDPPEPPAPAEAAGAVGTGSTDGHIKSLDTFGIGPGAAAGALADHVNDPDWAPAVGTTDVGSTDVALCGTSSSFIFPLIVRADPFVFLQRNRWLQSPVTPLSTLPHRHLLLERVLSSCITPFNSRP